MALKSVTFSKQYYQQQKSHHLFKIVEYRLAYSFTPSSSTHPMSCPISKVGIPPSSPHINLTAAIVIARSQEKRPAYRHSGLWVWHYACPSTPTTRSCYVIWSRRTTSDNAARKTSHGRRIRTDRRRRTHPSCKSIPQHISLFIPLTQPAGIQVVPDDNSCLFSSIGVVFEQDMGAAPRLRQRALPPRSRTRRT